MTSNGRGDKPQNTAGSKTAQTQPKTGQSAQSRARSAKKNVTIDLEAKDVTTKSGPANTKSEPEAKPVPTSEAVKSDAGEGATSKPSPKVVGSTASQNKTTAQPADNKMVFDEKKTSSGNTGEPVAAGASVAKTRSQKPPINKSGGFFQAVMAAFIGGIIAVLGFIALQMAGVFSSMNAASDGPDTAALEQRIAVIENLPVPESVNPSDIVGLAQRIATIEAAVDAPADSPVISEEVDARLTALEARLAQVETSRGADSGSGNDSGPAAVLEGAPAAGLADRLTAIEARLSAAGAKANASDLDALKQQISELDLKIVELSKAVTQAETATLSDEASSLLMGLSAELDTLKSDFDMLKSNGTDFVSQLATLTSKVDATQKAIAEQSGSNSVLREVAQTVALDNLKQVALSGAPFSDAFAALQKSGLAAEKVELIAPYANKGLPDTETLKIKLDELIGTALARGQPEPATLEAPQSAFDKLLSNARSVIKIRKIDDTTAPANSLFNQMREAFASGNTVSFVEALNKLDDGQKELFLSWVSDWKAVMSLQTLHIKTEKDEPRSSPTGSSEPASSDNTAQ